VYKRYAGHIMKDCELIPITFPKLSCDPNYGIIDGETDDGRSAIGTINKNLKF